MASTPSVLDMNAVDEHQLADAAGDPCTIVIFGASGDLTRRKLIPALHELTATNAGPPRFTVIGFARTPASDEGFRSTAVEAVRKSSGSSVPDEEKLRTFAQSFTYFAGEYDDPNAFQRLGHRMEEVDREHDLHGNRLYYLATPPAIYPLVIEQLKRAQLARPRDEKSWVRIIIEKPFGHDLVSAQQLNQRVLSVFDESQVYRIDHYLGKDTVQNLFVLRFGNGIYEPLWNRNYIDHVQITAAETLGVERRASFYEHAGALARHDPEPRIAAHFARRARAARQRLTRPRCAMKKPRCCSRFARLPRKRCGRMSCAGSMVPAPSTARAWPGTGRSPTCGPAPHGYIRCRASVDRQLALGRRAILSAYGQAPAETGDGNRHSVPARASRGVSRSRYRRKFADPEYSARRGHLALLSGEVAGAADAAEDSRNELLLSRGFWARGAQRLRHAFDRLHARRCHAFRPGAMALRRPGIW